MNALDCMSPLWSACKVLLRGMQILVNYAACCMTPMLLAVNAADFTSHAPNLFLNMKTPTFSTFVLYL
jgi:hypothetical protein